MTRQNNTYVEDEQSFIQSQASTAGPNRFRSFWSSSAAGNGSYLLPYDSQHHFTIHSVLVSISRQIWVFSEHELKDILHLGTEGFAGVKHHIIFRGCG